MTGTTVDCMLESRTTNVRHTLSTDCEHASSVNYYFEGHNRHTHYLVKACYT